jgi:hypothetical protein
VHSPTWRSWRASDSQRARRPPHGLNSPAGECKEQDAEREHRDQEAAVHAYETAVSRGIFRKLVAVARWTIYDIDAA